MMHDSYMPGNGPENAGDWPSFSSPLGSASPELFMNEQHNTQSLQSTSTESTTTMKDQFDFPQLSILDEFALHGFSFDDEENMLLPSYSSAESGHCSSDCSSDWTPTSSERNSPSPSPVSTFSSVQSASVSPQSSPLSQPFKMEFPLPVKPLSAPPHHPSMTILSSLGSKKSKSKKAPTKKSSTATTKKTVTKEKSKKLGNLVSRVSSGSLTDGVSLGDLDSSQRSLPLEYHNHSIISPPAALSSRPTISLNVSSCDFSATESSSAKTSNGLLQLAPLLSATQKVSSSMTSMGLKMPKVLAPNVATTTTVTTAVDNDNGNSTRKRKISSAHSVTSLTSKADELDQVLSEEEMEIRRERNRAHAKKSRQRKKCLTTELEHALVILKEENEQLREFIYRRIGQGPTEDILAKERLQSHKSFVAALQHRDNTVVDAKTATFLRGLRKNVLNLNKKTSNATANQKKSSGSSVESKR